MMKIAAGVFALFAAGAAVSGVQAQDGACTVTGTYSVQGVKDSTDATPPSIRKTLAGLGMAAKQNGCSLTVICVSAAGANEAAVDFRNKQCNVARDALSRFESRSTVRRTFRDTIERERMSERGTYRAGMVYVTAQ